jgi:hypothetical protein
MPTGDVDATDGGWAGITGIMHRVLDWIKKTRKCPVGSLAGPIYVCYVCILLTKGFFCDIITASDC